MKTIRTPTLEIAYEETGPAAGPPVVLLHGFPDDVRAYNGVAPSLAVAGWRVLVPYLRGYGPTRFLDPGTPRSGQQAALGRDLLDFLDALGIARAALAGYDWGGRAACIVAALWPERVTSLVSIGGYNIQNIARSGEPAAPEREHRLWYQWYFHTERGRAGLTKYRHELGKLRRRLGLHLRHAHFEAAGRHGEFGAQLVLVGADFGDRQRRGRFEAAHGQAHGTVMNQRDEQ